MRRLWSCCDPGATPFSMDFFTKKICEVNEENLGFNRIFLPTSFHGSFIGFHGAFRDLMGFDGILLDFDRNLMGISPRNIGDFMGI